MGLGAGKGAETERAGVGVNFLATNSLGFLPGDKVTEMHPTKTSSMPNSYSLLMNLFQS